ncbi:MAG: antitoxin [Verrucomicrobia bacterium]|nr:antitoxin [Verrucomicrobiota bacterium]
MRTTIDIDKPILDELKQLGKRQKKTIGQLVSELLAETLNEMKATEFRKSKRPLRWNSQPMGARVDIDDKDALYSAMDARK